MLYVSDVKEVGLKKIVSVTDTDDNVVESIESKKLAEMIENDKDLHVYGASYWNHDVECTVLTPNTRCNSDRLRSLIDKWRNVHNQWSGAHVEDYLACIEVGVVIEVQWETRTSSGSTAKGVSVLQKSGIDEWRYKDTSNVASGSIFNSCMAAWALEVACIYAKPIRFNVKNP